MTKEKIFFLIFLLIFTPQCSAASAKLAFSVVPDKNEYKPEEAINVNFKLENKGDSPIYVNKRFYLNSEDRPKEERDIYT